MRIHHKYIKQAETLLRLFNVYLVQYKGNLNGINHFTFGSPPGEATAIRIQKHQFVYLPIRFNNTRSMDDVLDVLHEAAHLILNDVTKGEDNGIAQLELVLSKRISLSVYRAMRLSHKRYYEWEGDTYEDMQLGKDWREGSFKVKRVLKKFLGNTLKDKDWSFLLEKPKVAAQESH